MGLKIIELLIIMQSSPECISSPLVKSTDTIISEYETIIRDKNTHNIKLENHVSHLSTEYKVAHSLIDKQYAKIRSLKEEIDDLKTDDSVSGDSHDGLGWWSGVNLDHVEIAAWKESDKKLRKQIKYLEFLNNLLKRKLSFRDGTLEMIRSAINGNTLVRHKDADECHDTGEPPSAANKTYYEGPGETIYRDNLEIPPLTDLPDTIDHMERNFDQVLHNWSTSAAIHKNTQTDFIPGLSSSGNKDADQSVGDEAINDIHGDIDSYPGYVENTQSIIDMLDYPETEVSFRTVFPHSSEHTFRNCCLNLVYGKMTSYNLWEESNTCYDIDYWKSYSGDQSTLILNSLTANYNNDYPDLKGIVDAWAAIYDNHIDKSNIIICKIVEWLFG